MAWQLARRLANAPRSVLRDWSLFVFAAALPALIAGLLGLRAIQNEEAAVRRQIQGELDESVERVTRRVLQAVERGALLLEQRPPAADEEALIALMARELPGLAAPFTIEKPSSPVRSNGRKPSERDDRGDSSACEQHLEAWRAHAGAERSSLAARIADECPLLMTPSRRFAVPIVLLEEADGAAAKRVRAWLEEHGDRVGASERRSIVARLAERQGEPGDTSPERSLAAAGRAIALAELEARLNEAPPGTVVPLRQDRAVGAAVRLEDGGAVGFAIDAASLRAADSAALAIDDAHRLDVHIGSAPSRASQPAGARSTWLAVAPDLYVAVAARDPDRAAAETARAQGMLAAGTAAGAALAIGLAALLFARMRAAKKSSELRTGFVSAVSHELRTPVASVRMLSELLHEGRLEPEEQHEVHETLVAESVRLSDTIDRMLRFSRFEAGRLVASRQLTDVAELAREVSTVFAARHPELPPVALDATSKMAAVDAEQVRMALENLLHNAAKYAPEGTPYRIELSSDGRRLTIAVRDRGPGVAAADRKRIFRAFERADDRLSAATEGTGIGLSLVAHVAAAHGGTAWVESPDGGGARFCFTIDEATGDGTR